MSEDAEHDVVVEAAGRWAHVRVYTPADRPVVVVVGELSDRPWRGETADLIVILRQVRESFAVTRGDETRWILYRPWETNRADALTTITATERGDVSTMGALTVSEVERMTGAFVGRYRRADYTCAGVRPSRGAVTAMAESHRRLTAVDREPLDSGEIRGVLDDMSRTLSRMRDVAAALAGDTALTPVAEELRTVLSGPLQRSLRETIAVAARGVEASAAAVAWPTDEPTLSAEFVMDPDLEGREPALGVVHVRLYRPGPGRTLVVLSQLEDAAAAPALAAAAYLLPRLVRRVPMLMTQNTRVVVFYPEGRLGQGAVFYEVRVGSAAEQVSYESVVAWAGGPVRCFSVEDASVARLP